MRKEILKTLVYFNLFDYPLTSLELWKFLQSKESCTLAELLTALEDPELQKQIEQKNGFIFLRGREPIVELRRERYSIAERKYRKVLWAVRFLRLIPMIRFVAVANTLALSYSRDNSDIDLFIVTRPGSIWLSRLLAVTPFALLGLRPKFGSERDTFCFSFFATETALDLSSIALSEDTYLLYWAATLVPVYDPDGLMEALWDENPWILRTLPNVYAMYSSTRRFIKSNAGKIKTFKESSGFLETLARSFQILRLPEPIRTIMNLDSRVIVTDEILKFHENDRRDEIQKRYIEHCELLNI